MTGNVITAKVSGSRPTPYKVTIRVPLFKKEQTDMLMKKLLEQPALISKLLNRELDPEVFHVAKRIGLNLFPQRWDDLDMNCSCPDWAVPCKHLAAVIYMMSREIDNDPFLVFSMHGVDLLEELKKRHVEIEKEQVMDVPDVSTLFVRSKNEIATSTEGEEKLHRVDFTSLRNITDALANLLPKQPSFSSGKDFQQVYAAQMGLISRKAQRILQGKLSTEFSRFPGSYEIKRDMKISYYANRYGLVFPYNGELSGKLDIMDTLWGDDFLDALSQLPADYLSNYDPSVQAVHQALFCALHLLANGAVVPQIVRVGDKYDIHWLPAMIATEVAQVVTALDKTILPGLFTLLVKKGRGQSAVALENQTELLLSHLLDCLVHTLSNHTEVNPVFILFFKEYTYAFDGIGEKATPGAIRS